MFKLFNKIEFPTRDNRMQTIADTKTAREIYNSSKSQNIKFLLHKRFDWMNKYIKEDDVGIELGSGAGFSRDFIKNKNLKLTDMSNDGHLDYKNVDAQKTNFQNESFNYVKQYVDSGYIPNSDGNTYRNSNIFQIVTFCIFVKI